MSKGKEGAFIYADESGHSGKDIFNEKSPIYYQGAVISVSEIETKVAPIIKNIALIMDWKDRMVTNLEKRK